MADPYSGLSIRTQKALIDLDRQSAPAAPAQGDFPMGGRTVDPRATIPHPGGTGEMLTPESAAKLKTILELRKRQVEALRQR